MKNIGIEMADIITYNNYYSIERQLSTFYDEYRNLAGHRSEARFFTTETDFIVREICEDRTPDITLPDYDMKDKKLFLNYTLVKKNISTFDCAKVLAEYFSVNEEDIGYSGLKDNFAITSQIVSVPLEKVAKERILATHVFDRFFLKDPYVSIFPRHIGLHLGNNFLIRFYADSLDTDTRQLILSRFESMGKGGVPNIYGIQRFGPRRINHIVGKKLIARDYEEAARVWLTSSVSKWELGELIDAEWGNWEACLKVIGNHENLEMERRFFRSMITNNDFGTAFESIPLGKFFVRSFSSFLFNEALYNLINDGKLHDNKDMLVRVGYDTDFSEENSKIYNKILAYNNVLPEYFKFDDYPGLSQSGGKRSVLVFPQNCSISFDKDGGNISFSLGRGMYATVVLNFLFEGADYNKQIQ